MTPAEAWSAVVTGEDAAVFAYSVAGARVGATDRARSGLEAHRAHRSRAAALVLAAGGNPPVAAAAYELPADVGTSRGARAALAGVDNALVAVYADAAAAAEGPDRRWAARMAAECARRAVAWGAETQAFPTGPSAP